VLSLRRASAGNSTAIVSDRRKKCGRFGAKIDRQFRHVIRVFSALTLLKGRGCGVIFLTPTELVPAGTNSPMSMIAERTPTAARPCRSIRPEIRRLGRSALSEC
jgi:hypothetical protein